jgi:Beta-lactamase class C and other penicillin binding proteins
MACASEIGLRYGFELTSMAAKLAAATTVASATTVARDQLFVAESDEGLLGFAWIDLRGAFSSAPYLRLIAVDEAKRGYGVGAALLEEFESRGACVGRDYCLLVSDFNVRAQAFYERHGYRKAGELPDFAVPGIAEVLMVKRRVPRECASHNANKSHNAPSAETGNGIEEAIRRHIDAGLYPGAVVRVERIAADACELLYEGAFGLARGRSPAAGGKSVPMEDSTLFDLASVTKLFTTTAALRLASEGAFGLEDGVASLLRRYSSRLGIEASILDRITSFLSPFDLADLLDHSTGMHYWFPFYTRKGESFEAILADILEAHPPTGRMIYSDLNFMLLGRIVEGATGKSLPEAVGELVLEPLGLSRSSYRTPRGPSAASEFGNRIEKGMVADLGLSFDSWCPDCEPMEGRPNDGNCHYFFGGAAGHAGLFSDARDLCRLGRLYLEEGRIGDRQWIAPGLARDALRDRGEGRGLGFQLGENYPRGGAGHTGFSGTYLHVNPPSGLVIVLLANRLHVEKPANINACRREVSEAALSAYS